MKKAVLASKNPHKLAELQKILGGFGMEVVLESDVGVDVDVEETGTTFAENSFLKANAVMRATGLPAIADDSGLAVDALGGAPGVYSARYGGLDSDAARIALLLQNMQDVPDAQRTAQFVCAITYLTPDGQKITAEGRCPGMILRECRGDNGFGYDPVFYVPEKGKTFAELAGDEKNALSHRGLALAEFARRYREENEHDK